MSRSFVPASSGRRNRGFCGCLVADPETDKTGGVNSNLWAGLALLVVGVGVGFLLWARLRPVVVPETTD
ncbi:hypothetical protein NPS01_33480 [Nocardioides psychrotolerans]|uniref:LPXTG cell wall anchor domain-containing protein n=1 Tax=Nocardioides psychrotolerans TaxID=1005945 RepID=A0A1I3PJD0_9ACTN|nr:hypothetical protein [Nocardioides psychrotolerans]GEP39685.1 hypothetical protein NPS01_33480 [Nocardioides psychrotolerans]SFJ21784.1 hypothetical protein SAMN05216561_12112 [Nocardioides psychrotolerans]